jgi:hypothetical protein
MPKGPQGQKRPADVIGAAVRIMRIATGEETEELNQAPASAAAQLGKLGGAARARNLTAEQKSEIARKGAAKRWSKSQVDKNA